MTKQYAIIETKLQASLHNKFTSELKAIPNLRSFLCLTTYEVALPIPFLITVLDKSVNLDSDDLILIHEQYRRIYNVHFGLWLIVTSDIGQYEFLNNHLPIGHAIYVMKIDNTLTYNDIAECTSGFYKSYLCDRTMDRCNTVMAKFQIEIVRCLDCGQRFSIVTGVYLFKRKNILDSSSEEGTSSIFIPAKNFSFPLYKYASTLTQIRYKESGYYCSLCQSELIKAATPEILLKESIIRIYLTADDCLQYLVI